MITMLRQHVASKFGSLPWRSRSQHDLAAKSCQAHNFVIWNRILQLFLAIYLFVSNTYSGSITRFDRLLFWFKIEFCFSKRVCPCCRFLMMNIFLFKVYLSTLFMIIYELNIPQSILSLYPNILKTNNT